MCGGHIVKYDATFQFAKRDLLDSLECSFACKYSLPSRFEVLHLLRSCPALGLPFWLVNFWLLVSCTRVPDHCSCCNYTQAHYLLYMYVCYCIVHNVHTNVDVGAFATKETQYRKVPNSVVLHNSNPYHLFLEENFTKLLNKYIHNMGTCQENGFSLLCIFSQCICNVVPLQN